jgi:hypothetical protein
MIRLAVIASLLGALLGFAVAWQWQSSKVDAITAEYKGFVDTTQALGNAAQKEADEREARDRANKQKADHENKLAMATLRADIKRLRDARAGGSYLPSPPASSGRPDLATFDRAELESALRAFDAGVQGLVDEGSEATVNLNSAKTWALQR